MAKNKILAGIDVGSSKVTTIVASHSIESGRTNIVGLASLPSRGIRKSQIIDIEEATKAIIESLEAAERMAGFNLTSIYMSVSGVHIESQNSKGVVAVSDPEGEIVPEDVHRVIEAARAVSLSSSREIIHVIPRYFIVDSQEGIKDPVGMPGVRLEVDAHLVTGSSIAIRNLVKCGQEVGVDISGVVYSGLASAYSTLSPTDKELGSVLVDIGGGTTSIAVFVEGALSHSAVLPIGANNVTNDLAIGLRVSLKSAEAIKVFLSEYEINKKKETIIEKKKDKKDNDKLDLSRLNLDEGLKSVSYKTVVEGIIRPRLQEIFTMVGCEVEKSGLADNVPSGVVLCGGGAMTVGAAESCKRTLRLNVRIADKYDIGGLIDEINTPSMSCAVGLIKYGLDIDKSQGSVFNGFKSFSSITQNLPIKGAISKVVDLVKSILP